MARTGSGVETRDSSIRIKFDFEGETIRERLTVNGVALPPTPANLKYAKNLGQKIREKIANGTFVYEEYFPESPRAKLKTPTSFGSVADMWFKTKGQLEAATRNQYKNGINVWNSILGADKPMDRLTYQVLASTIGGHSWASGKSANNYLIVLRGIFAFHYNGPLAAQNPMLSIKNLSTIKKKPDPLKADDRDRILDDMAAHYDPRVYAYFKFAFYTGMRPEEIIALRWTDIDFGDCVARVQRVRTFRGREREGGKTHTERDVELVSDALQALKIMKPYTFLKNPDGNIFERPEWHPSKGSRGGKPQAAGPWENERQQRETYWKPSLRRLGIRYRRAYVTRHTYATAALANAMPPLYVADQMGHTNMIMLSTKYSRWIKGGDKGQQRLAMEAALNRNKSQISPKETTDSNKSLISLG